MKKNREKKHAVFGKRLMSLALSAILIFALSAAVIPTGALAAGDSVNSDKFGSDNIYSIVPSGSPSEFGYQETKVVGPDGNEVTTESVSSSGSSSGLLRAAPLPSSYDSRSITTSAGVSYVSSVKNQKGSGCCWAFATLSSLESSCIIQGLGTFFDFSELHLAYFGNNSQTTDASDPTYGDGVTSSTPYDDGGNFYISGAALARGSGAVDEYYAPFTNGYTDYKNTAFYETERYQSDMMLDDMSVIYSFSGIGLQKEAPSSSDRTLIKQAIMASGSVQMSYYASGAIADYTGNNGQYCYCTADYPGSNHAVSVVGWDDNYSASNFKASGASVDTVVPTSDGAWLIKNSWGSDWADGGYFWLSYEDRSANNFVSFSAADTSSADNIYQYDGCWDSISFYNEKDYSNLGLQGANVFTASGSETLTQVGFYSLNTSASAKVEVYLLGSGDTVVSSAPVSAVTYNITSPGYKTVGLTTNVALTAGQRFSVVITITSDTQPVYFVTENAKYGKGSAGQSYMSSYTKGTATTSGSWSDLGAESGINTIIKAYTKDNSGADKTSLQSLYDTVASSNNYFCAAYDEMLFARSVLNDENASGIDVETAYNRLNSAYYDLVNNSTSYVFIASASDYISFAMSVNSGTSYKGRTVVLTGDIDFTGQNYIIAGVSSARPFTGKFQGAGHTLSNISYTATASPKYAGVFGYADTASIWNLNVSSSSFAGSYAAGIATGIYETNIFNCTFSGTLNGTYGTAGIAYYLGSGGNSNSKIQNCTSTPDNTNSVKNTSDVFGIAGPAVGSNEYYNNSYSGSMNIRKYESIDFLPYYVSDGNNVFLSMSAIVNGEWKYIAPAGTDISYMENQKNFGDISTHWGVSFIKFVTERNIFSGTSASTFSPDMNMTRGMFATVMSKMYKTSFGSLDTSGAAVFSDVPSDAYYAQPVAWASSKGIISGIGGGRFAPDNNVTRQEMALMLYKLAKVMNIDTTVSSSAVLKYPDTAGIADWAKQAALWCQETGLISGRDGGNFVPQGTATRAEVATVLCKFINYVVTNTPE